MNKFSSAIILAGGKSSRMGFDKQFIKINEETMVDIIASNLEKLFDEIIVITNKPEEYINSKYKISSDVIKEKGPLSGIHAGLSICSSEYALVIACDMPNVSLEYISYMKKLKIDKDIKAIVTSKGDWIEPLNSFYSKNLVVDIENYLNEGKGSINGFLKSLNIHQIPEEKAREFSNDWSMFMNINTKQDLDLYLKDKIK